MDRITCPVDGICIRHTHSQLRETLNPALAPNRRDMFRNRTSTRSLINTGKLQKVRLPLRRQVPRRRRRRTRRLRQIRDGQHEVRRALEGREARRRDQRPQRQHE